MKRLQKRVNSDSLRRAHGWLILCLATGLVLENSASENKRHMLQQGMPL